MNSTRMILILSVVTLFCSNPSNAYTPGDTLWTDVFPDPGSLTAIQPAENGSVVTLANTDSTAVMRWVNEDGELLQTLVLQGGVDIVVGDFAAYPDGGYVFAGSIYRSNENRFAVFRTDADGNLIWLREWNYVDPSSGGNIIVDADGDILATGGSAFPQVGLIWKLSPSGETIFRDDYGGMQQWHWIVDAIVTNTGNYLICGYVKPHSSDEYDAWAMELSPNGGTIWQETYATDEYDYFRAVAQLEDGFVFGGSRYSPEFGTYALCVRTDSEGHLQWESTFGNLSEGSDRISDILPAADGSIGFCGMHGSGWNRQDLWIGELDQYGTLVWDAMYGSDIPQRDSAAHEFIELPAGGYMVAGGNPDGGWLLRIYDDPNPGYYPVIVSAEPLFSPVIVPPYGLNLHWHATLTNTADEPVALDAWTIAETPLGNTVGPLDENLNFTIGAGETISHYASQRVPAYAPPGEYIFTLRAGNYPDALTEDSFTFTKAESGASGSQLTDWASMGWDLSTTTGADESSTSSGLPSSFRLVGVYPNPFNARTVITVELPGSAPLTIQMFNITGQLVHTVADGMHSAGTHSFTLDAGSLASGVYFMHAVVPGELNEIRRVALVR